jgi:hypothetical protein
MDPTQFEKNLSEVYQLLDELKTGELSENFGNGYDDRVYNKGLSKSHLDKKTAELCSLLKKTDVTKYSLEMQMWWRDHQKADKERLLAERQKRQDKKEIKEALAKLTEKERKLLGY